MTTYTDKLIEAMATGAAIRLRCRFSGDSARCRDCQLGGACKVSVLSTDLTAERAALIAQLKFMIEHGPSEEMIRVAAYESDARSIFIAAYRALLAELEGP